MNYIAVCSNGNPIRIRTAKGIYGYELHALGYTDFSPYTRYDICHTKSRHVRLVKVYCYADDRCDYHFYTSSLRPIPHVSPLKRIPADPAVLSLFSRSLTRLLNKAIHTVHKERKQHSIYDELSF